MANIISMWTAGLAISLGLTHFQFSSVSNAIAQQQGDDQAVECRSNKSEMETEGGTVRLRDYLCDGSDGLRLRIQFHRVTDTIADALLVDSLPSNLAPILGGIRFITNPVSQRFSELMEEFGENLRWGCTNTQQFTPGESSVRMPVFGGEYDSECIQSAERWRSIGNWEDSVSEMPFFPATGDLQYMMENEVFHPEYNIAKNENLENYELSSIAWRNLKSDDFSNIESKFASFNALIRKNAVAPANTPATRMYSYPEDIVKFDKQLRLFSMLAESGMPKGFSVIEAQFYEYEGCASNPGWSLMFYPRELLVEFAVIENLSLKPITIEALSGARPRTDRLRGTQNTNSIVEAPKELLNDGDLKLAPSERVGLFQRLKFVAPIQPKYVELPIFDYGPAEFLRSFKVNNLSVHLDQRSHNATLLTFSTEAGSCPFLFVKEADGEWVNHGKVLHKAKGEDLQQWDERSFKGFRSVFRLAELEPERALIDSAALDITLHSGQVITLLPQVAELALRDGASVSLYMHEHVPVRFELPDGVDEKQVSRSTLRLFGYYDRYSDLAPIVVARMLLSSSESQICTPLPSSRHSLARSTDLAFAN